MNYHNIKHDDMVNGDGLRVTLFVSGCSNHCEGCQNPQTWDPDSGIVFDTSAMAEILDYLGRDYISGLTISGGDPFFKSNIHTVTEICDLCKLIAPCKTIWLYTGYNWVQIKDLEVLRYIDVLVEGPYIEAERDVNMHWAGSRNQRVIDVQRSLSEHEVILYKGESQ